MRYAKAVMAAVGTVATWAVTALSDGHIDQVEVWGLFAALAATFGVFQVPNVLPPRSTSTTGTYGP